MSNPAHIPWLLLVFRPRLTLAWMASDVGSRLLLEGAAYEAESESDLTAFYDRIYNRASLFVGIQVTPVRAHNLPRLVSGLPYVRAIEEQRQLQVFFRGYPTSGVEVVPDQAFGGRVYQSGTGELAISLDTYFLEDGERDGIVLSDARWVDVTPF